MKKSTHSKFKNTAILFELLTRQVASDTIRGVDQPPAIQIIKHFFGPKSELAKELTLYNTLLKEKFTHSGKAEYLINTAIRLRSKLNNQVLKEQKYNLIREIKKHYDLIQFFKTPLSEYKLCASIYRLFEGATIAHVAEVVNSRYTVLEHLTRKAGTSGNGVESELYLREDRDVQLLAYKLMLDKFNSKYNGLSTKQKGILREYINSVSNTTTLRTFVTKEADLLRKGLGEISKKVEDPVVTIKLKEVARILEQYSTIRTVKEKHVQSLLLYHELLKHLANVVY